MPTAPISLGTRSLARARDTVYERLREAIVTAELEPGQKLSENELAGWLGVSRTPVREALVRLRDDRLVEIVPQLGTFVARISDAAVGDAQFVRESLECAAIRIAATKAAPADVLALKAILARQETARDGRDFDGFYVLDDELHAALCELSGHGVAWRLAGRANGHLNRVRRLSLPEPDYLAEMVVEHGEVVAAVEAGDPDAAEAALRHHLRMVLSVLPGIRQEHPVWFEEEEGAA
jgi:GntR family transcriptional regulator, rspAB operon transcriptional repressor